MYVVYLLKDGKVSVFVSLAAITLDPIQEAFKFIIIMAMKQSSSNVWKQNAVERLKQNKVACQYVLHKTR